jgi:hypothetical protein
VVLAAAGVLASHTLGYGMAHLDPGARAEALQDHGYLVVLSWLIGPAAVVALGWLAVLAARAAGPDGVFSPRRLTLVMWGLLAVQEVGERVASGEIAELPHEPGVWWSAAAVVVVARVLTTMARSAGRVLRRLWVTRPRRLVPVAVWPPLTPLVLATGPLPSPVSVRGPPLSRRF